MLLLQKVMMQIKEKIPWNACVSKTNAHRITSRRKMYV